MTEMTQPGKAFETVATMFRHNLWANLSLFDVCAGLSDEQLNSRVAGAYGSIRATLEHIMRAERAYHHRVTTGRPYRAPEDAPPPTLDEMRASLRRTGEGFIAVAPQVQAGDSVEIDWDGTPRIVPTAIILTQAINHATEHRAQIMVMLTQIGVEPPDIDGWTYFDTHDA